MLHTVVFIILLLAVQRLREFILRALRIPISIHSIADICKLVWDKVVDQPTDRLMMPSLRLEPLQHYSKLYAVYDTWAHVAAELPMCFVFSAAKVSICAQTPEVIAIVTAGVNLIHLKCLIKADLGSDVKHDWICRQCQTKKANNTLLDRWWQCHVVCRQ